ncbi:MAG: hypothetical protein GTO22_08650 [Gemmatimonadales bacterium]|nr:hypothetical protein [Gemmatimonadales bacterium]
MTKGRNPPLKHDRGETRRFTITPNVYYDGVPWFQDEGVFEGEVLADGAGTVRLYAPQGAPEPAYIDVPCYWARLVSD